MEFRVLGPVRMWRDGLEVDPGPPGQRAVLALLLVRAGQPVPLPDFVDVLWGQGPPDTAANVMHRHIGALRRLLEPGRPARGASRWLVRGSGGYRLDVPRAAVDLRRFRELRREAATGPPGAAAEALVAALTLWRGPVGDGLPPGARSHPVFRSLDGERLSALKDAADHAPAAAPAVVDRLLATLRPAAAEHPPDADRVRERLQEPSTTL